MKKSVNIQGVAIRPLPKELIDKVGCTNCQNRSARWEMEVGAEMASSFSCSACFLYDYPVVRDQREAVEFLISGVEKMTQEQFERTPEGRLADDSAADRIVAGILMAQRYELTRGLI